MRGLIGGGEYAEQKAAMIAPMASTFVGRLEHEKARLEERLQTVNETLDLLKTHPQMGDLLTALQKLGI